MPEKTVIYAKLNEKEAIPLTLRIEWLPDGTIIPLMYWTPDGTCHKVVGCSQAVSTAFLKEGGEGLRYKICGEIVETPEPYSEALHNQYEAYLYLADRKFSEKNIVDGRYGHACKEYIPVTLDVFPDGSYELIYFWVKGMRYIVEKTHDIDRCGSFYAGGVGIRHKVEARLINADNDDDPDPHNTVTRLASVYLELNKWFCAVANAG